MALLALATRPPHNHSQPADLLDLVAAFARHQAALVSVMKQLDTPSPNGRLMLALSIGSNLRLVHGDRAGMAMANSLVRIRPHPITDQMRLSLKINQLPSVRTVVGSGGATRTTCEPLRSRHKPRLSRRADRIAGLSAQRLPADVQALGVERPTVSCSFFPMFIRR